MKQRISIIAPLILLLAMVACGGGGNGSNNNTSGGTEGVTPGAGVDNDNDSLTPTVDANDNVDLTPNANDNLTPTADPNDNDSDNDNLDQSEDPSQGEPDKGDAVGSTDEGLDALGGGFEWRREGGIAGFCDIVTVLAGTATVASCASEPPQIVAEVTLTADQSRRMMTWLEELRTFEHEQSDGPVADGMNIHLIFAGEGAGEPTEEIIADIEALAIEILNGMARQ